MAVLEKVVNFLNLTDAAGKLSITNLAVLICLVKLAISPSASITEAGALLAALVNYGHKRAINATPEPADTSAIDSKVEEIQATVSNLALKAGLKL